MSSARDEERTSPEGSQPPSPPEHTLAVPDAASPRPQSNETIQFEPAPASLSDAAIDASELKTIADPSALPVLGQKYVEEAPSLSVDVPDELHKHPRYKIMQRVGGGGMGQVYQAEHRLMDRPVALKIIHPRYLAHPSAVERFEREVKAAARLHHPNIVTAYDAERAGNTHFLIMEFVQGETLASLLRRKGKLDLAEACDVVRQTAQGLEYAHREHKMVHRDIKPDNLMRTINGDIKILDFGLARFAQEEGLYAPADALVPPDTLTHEKGKETQTQFVEGHSSLGGEPTDALTAAGTVMGTPDYMAPEQIHNTHAADIRSDIYALGCTLYQLLTGRVLFPEGKPQDKLERQVRDAPTPVRQLRPEVPLALAQILDKMLAKDPAQRYQTPGEVARALSGFCKKVNPRKKWWRRGVAAGLLLLVLGGFAAAFWYWKQSNHGTLQIDAEVPQVSIAIYRADNKDTVFRAVQLTDGSEEIELPPGEYVFALPRGPGGARFVPEKVTIERARVAHLFLVKPAEKTHEAWATLPVPSAEELARRASPFDGLKAVELPANLAPHSLPPGMELAAVLGGTTRRLAGVGSYPSFSADGELVAVGSGNDLVLFETVNGKVRQVFKGHDQPIEFCALSPDGKWLASSSRDGTTRLWSAEKAAEIENWSRTQGPVAFSPDSRTLAYSQTPHLRLYDLESKATADIHLGSQPSMLAFHPKGDWILVPLLKASAALVSPRTKKVFSVTASVKTLGGERLQGAFDERGKLFAVGSGAEVIVLETPTEDDTKLTAKWRAFTGGDGLVAFANGVLYAARHNLGFPETPQIHPFHATTGKRLGVSLPVASANTNIACLSMSPDRRWIGVCLIPDGRVLHLYDLKNHRLVDSTTGHVSIVKGLDFSPDGKRLLSIGADRKLYAWDLETQTVSKTWPAWAYPFRIAISPDGERVAAAMLDKTVRFLGTKDGFAKVLRHTANPLSLAYDADGSTLFAGGSDGRILAIDSATLKDKEAYATTTVDVEGLTLDRTGKHLAAAGTAGKIHIWHVGSARQIHLLAGHSTDVFPEPTGVRALACSADNRLLFSAGRDGTVRVWDWDSGKRLKILHGLTNEVLSLAPSPDGRLLAAGGADGQILLWDLALPTPRRLTLRPITRGGRDGYVWGLAFSPEGRYLAAGLGDGTIQIYRLAPPGGVIDLSHVPPGVMPEDNLPAPEGIVDWRLHPREESIVSLHRDGMIRHWNRKTGEELSPSVPGGKLGTQIAFAPDGNDVFIASPGFKSASTLRRWKLGEKAAEDGATMTGFVLSVNGLGQVLIRSKEGGRLVNAKGLELLSIRTPSITLGTVSPDGRWVIIAAGEKAILHDVSARKAVRTFVLDIGKTLFAFSPDSTRLAWVNGQEEVTLFDLDRLREMPRLRAPSFFVREIAFSPDNRYLALATMPGTLTIYDLATGRTLEQLRTPPLTHAAFTRDGHLITSHLAGAPRVWKLP